MRFNDVNTCGAACTQRCFLDELEELPHASDDCDISGDLPGELEQLYEGRPVAEDAVPVRRRVDEIRPTCLAAEHACFACSHDLVHRFVEPVPRAPYATLGIKEKQLS